jgi:hypothetical protein
MSQENHCIMVAVAVAVAAAAAVVVVVYMRRLLGDNRTD